MIGTTDTPIEKSSLEPKVSRKEIDFILENAHDYLATPPTVKDILSAFSGIRPLVKANTADTSKLSRDHTISVSKSGLMTITGGKWTTYRHMAEDLVDHAEMLGGFESIPCVTKQLRIHGFHRNPDKFGELACYGSDAPALKDMLRHYPDWKEKIHPRLTPIIAQVMWAIKYEMARTVDDVLARRTRCLVLDARAALEAAPKVARLMAKELERDDIWIADQIQTFQQLAQGYIFGE